jgi:hypothetical protein
MICALLVLRTTRLPAPLARLSPWLDWLVEPRDEVFDRLAAQPHRRFIKTHTPLDGIPLDPRATYIVVARHPLDMAVSLYHQVDNLDRVRLHQLTGNAEPGAEPEPEPESSPAPGRAAGHRPGVREWLLSWIDDPADPRERLDSLPGVMWHLSDAWARRDEPNVVLVRYEDLLADLAGQMRRLAARLGIAVPEDAWPDLVEAATFDRMRADALRLAPDPAGILKDTAAFFRRGSAGSGAAVLTTAELARYRARAAELAAPDMLAWLHGAPAGRR